MKGTVSKGESLALRFDAEQVTFMGSSITFVDIQKSETNKSELIGLARHGVIEKWQEMSDRYEVQMLTKDIDWED